MSQLDPIRERQQAGASDQVLAPMLTPRSIALVGASPRPNSIGNATAKALLGGHFQGPISFINPRHDEIEGRSCVASLADLDAPPDLAILNVGAARIEQTLEDTILAGARSAIIFDACHGVASTGESLLQRLRDMARAADIPVCGGNGMGLFNLTDGVHASFYPADHLTPGGITLIAHSGSVFTVLGLNDPRYRFDLMISPGQEIGTTIDAYVDFAVSRTETKVIALFMEQARNPRAFVAALERARDAGTPVVVCKVGRTSESAVLAQSHSGAMAGSADGYDAVLARYGAVSVETIDQLMNAAMLLASGRVMGDGEAAMVTDSGGLRELMIDRASTRHVPLAQLSDGTKNRLRDILPANLPPSNPLDCAGAVNDDFALVFEDGLRVLSDAPEVACLGYEFDARDDFVYEHNLLRLAHELPEITSKPCFGYSSFSNTNNRQLVDELMGAGLPFFNGLDETLSAIAVLRQFRERNAVLDVEDPLPQSPSQAVIDRWKDRLGADTAFGEADVVAMLGDFGVPSVNCVSCDTWEDVRMGAEQLGYPVVLKTAVPGIAHKSDVNGVFVGLKSEQALLDAYESLVGRLGPQVIVQSLAPGGVELAFGSTVDPDFGPLVMVSAGGTLIELLDDRQVCLAPFGVRQAARMLQSLKVFPMLNGARGAAPCDVEAVSRALAAFSLMCATLGDHFSECDVNPLLVNDTGVVAVDGLLVGAQSTL